MMKFKRLEFRSVQRDFLQVEDAHYAQAYQEALDKCALWWHGADEPTLLQFRLYLREISNPYRYDARVEVVYREG